MTVRELISWRDVMHCVVAALVMTLVFCGIPYVAAGGPMPTLQIASAATVHPVHAKKLIHSVTVRQDPVVLHKTVVTARTYRVRPGDTLAGLSLRFYGSSNYWTTIYWANSHAIRYANIIYVGQTFTVPAAPHTLAAPRTLSPPAPRPNDATLASVHNSTVHGSSAALSSGRTYQCGDGDGDGYDVPCSQPIRSAPVQAVAVARATAVVPQSGFQACVIARESGGNPQVMNASGHYGLYQFSASTWAAYGGSPADFGHASEAEQNQVFANAMATAGGASNWSPYDGC
jgi:LysM repeat protein